MTEANGIPIGCVTAPANRDDSPLLAPTLDTLTKFNGYLPEHITVHLDACYDSTKTRVLLTESGFDWCISTKGESLQAGARWVVPTPGTTAGSRNYRFVLNDAPKSWMPSSAYPTPSSSSGA